MPSAEQLKALLKSHIEGNDEHFLSVAMQVAAHEARNGHGKLAHDLRALIDSAKKERAITKKPTPMVRPKGELIELFSAGYPQLHLADIVLPNTIKQRLTRLIKEHRNVQKIRAHGLSPRKKMLLIGPSGTGKTMTASVLAGELSLPLFVVRLDSLMTKFMGETAAKLRLIFDAISQTRGVYLFDEFDSIGAHRGLTNDVGEIRRVLNSFLQLIEQDDSDSLLVAATNHPELLDKALYRRFDDVVEFLLPNKTEISKALKSKTAAFPTARIQWAKVAESGEGMSYGDITGACQDAIKNAIIHDKPKLLQKDLVAALEERRHSHVRRN
ncbi:MAG: ATP-binding protein [Sedimenticola sp.]